MELKDILSISGYPGLYKFISQGRSGVIVESLESKKRMNAHSSLKIIALDDIQIFTESGEVSLSEVFDKIYRKEDGGKAINHKSSSGDLKEYMEEILPEYDRDRVYVSDIKKIVLWYNTLHELNMLHPKKEEEESDAKKTEEESGEQKDKPSKEEGGDSDELQDNSTGN